MILEWLGFSLWGAGIDWSAASVRPASEEEFAGLKEKIVLLARQKDFKAMDLI
ncbi:MAG: hypothetical protein ACP5O3_00630 [Candidatus Micrarchaeia archaeon]